jgi:hypothetical protein
MTARQFVLGSFLSPFTKWQKIYKRLAPNGDGSRGRNNYGNILHPPLNNLRATSTVFEPTREAKDKTVELSPFLLEQSLGLAVLRV